MATLQDTCMTSLFSSSWMCRLCGRETCAECFDQVKDLTVDRPGAGPAEILALQARREKHAHSNPFFLSCTRRNEHQAKDFSPLSRFCKSELEQAIEEMKRLIQEPATPPAEANGGTNGGYTQQFRAPNLDNPLIPWSGMAHFFKPPIPDSIPPTSTNPSYIPPNLSHTILSIPNRPIAQYTESVLTPEAFPKIWSLGQPLVVTNLLSKFNIQWTPEYFVEKYGEQSCLIIECQTEMNKRITVGDFFGHFGKYQERTECWKLKVNNYYFVADVPLANTILLGLAAFNGFQDCIPGAVRRFQPGGASP
jgi:lysine-specific demethylase 3